MNSKYCQYLYKNSKKKSVVGIGGMDVYIEIHISNIERNKNENVGLDWEFEPGTLASLVRWSTTELSRPISIHGPSRPITTFLPLQIKFLPSKKQTTNKCSPCQDLITDFTNDAVSKMVRAPNVTEKRVNIEVNNFFYIEEGKCVKV